LTPSLNQLQINRNKWLLKSRKSEAETHVNYAAEIFHDQKFVNINDEMLSSQLGAPVVKKLPTFYRPEFSLLYSKVSAIFSLSSYRQQRESSTATKAISLGSA